MSNNALAVTFLAACSLNGHAVGPRLGAAAPAAAPTAVPSRTADAADSDPPPMKHAVVPDLVGLTLADANARLRAAGFDATADPDQGSVTSSAACTDGTHVDVICAQSPLPGNEIDFDGPIFVRIGSHDARLDKAIAPDVRGMHLADAKAAFARAGFMATPEVDSGAGCKPDIVCTQTPNPGPAKRGSLILLYVGP